MKISEKAIKLTITKKLNKALAYSPEMDTAINEAVFRFRDKDYGDIEPADIEANEKALAAREGYVLGKYPTPKGNIFINLNFHDELAEDIACLMFCEEY